MDDIIENIKRFCLDNGDEAKVELYFEIKNIMLSNIDTMPQCDNCGEPYVIDYDESDGYTVIYKPTCNCSCGSISKQRNN